MSQITPSDRKIAAKQTAPFQPFVYPEGQALQDAELQLDCTAALGPGFHIHRMPASMTPRGHRHNGHAQYLILEGELPEATAGC